MKKVSGSTTTVSIFSGSQVIAEYNNGAAPSSPTNEYIYAGGQKIAILSSGSTTYYHSDHLSIRLRTNSSGNVVDQRGHYPFGDTWYLAPSNAPLVFTSYYRDSESSNDYAQARFYRWLLARFLSPDPLSGSVSDPQSLNRYTYVENNPISLLDPSGMMETEDCSDSDDNSCGGAGDGGISAIPCLAACGYNPHGYLQNNPTIRSSSLNPPAPFDPDSGDFPASFFSTADPYYPSFGELFQTSGFGGGTYSIARTPKNIKAIFYMLYQQKLNDCISQIFGADAANVPTQTLANAPILNANYNGYQLAVAQSGGNVNAPSIVGWNNPSSGLNGTVYVANGVLHSNGTNALNFALGTYAHELSNILDERMNPSGTTGGQPYGGTYGNIHDPLAQRDFDTGAQIEICIFGAMQGPNGPYPAIPEP